MTGRRTRLARARKAAGYTQEELAYALELDVSTIQRWEAGKSEPAPYKRPKLAHLLKLSGTRLDQLLHEELVEAALSTIDSDEEAAWELARRVAASDMGDVTLSQLENIVDELARAYPTSAPADLSSRIRGYLSYVAKLMDGRKTLGEHRRLLVIGGWLSLLAATVHIDLKQPSAARAHLRTADSLAMHAEHDEIRAWGYETEAWWRLTDADYLNALEFSRRAQSFAPLNSSIAIQAVAQEGRALARLGHRREMYDAVGRVEDLVSPLQIPAQPEHHYRYDPTKAVAYLATTLAWAGDPAAEGFAREIIARLSPGKDVTKWPRRVAAANLDLALALIVSDRLDEACDATERAISSGRVVPSNHWRAAEVVKAVERRGLPEAKDLRAAYDELLLGRSNAQ